VEMTLDPSEVGKLDDAAMKAKYDAEMKKSQAGHASDRAETREVLEDHLAKSAAKRRRQDDDAAGRKFKF
jgi:glucose-6-phosphate isomerase